MLLQRLSATRRNPNSRIQAIKIGRCDGSYRVLTFSEIAYKSNECHRGFIGDVFEFCILGQQAGCGPDGIYIFAERIRDVLVEFCTQNYKKS